MRRIHDYGYAVYKTWKKSKKNHVLKDTISGYAVLIRGRRLKFMCIKTDTAYPFMEKEKRDLPSQSGYRVSRFSWIRRIGIGPHICSVTIVARAAKFKRSTSPVFHVSQLKLCKGNTFKMGILPQCSEDGLLSVEPKAILDDLMKRFPDFSVLEDKYLAKGNGSSQSGKLQSKLESQRRKSNFCY
uniref:Uncharacterized protein n=1 Tax=Tanacetum cinerariifolium TaxID=118510 RepID=A0A699HIK2_TANCI|nr:hypothetical protein [Tanacetum cinerariifolium]